MFTVNHFIWLGICVVLGVAAFLYLKRHRPPLRRALTVACIICVLSEFIKTLSVLQMVPSSDGASVRLYLEMQHLPLHLCSIQIIFIFFVRFARDGRVRDALLAFMYPTCTLGALFALALPSIFTSTIEVSQAFVHPLAYQFFLFHTMLVVLGIYIAVSGEVDIQPRHYLSSLGILAGMGFISIYFNSMFAVPTYVDDVLVSVDYSTNFFFTEFTPIGMELTELWQWGVYMGIIAALAVVLIGLWYIPYFVKAYRTGKHKNKD